MALINIHCPEYSQYAYSNQTVQCLRRNFDNKQWIKNETEFQFARLEKQI